MKAVIPKTSEGRIVNAVINAKIFKDSEYVLSPLADSVIVSASNPPGTACENPKTGNKNVIIRKILNFFI